MKRALVLAAALVVLVSSLSVVVSTHQNRTQPSGGTLELTERELRLVPTLGESTVTALALQWDAGSGDPLRTRSPEWLNVAKLTELGFDCRKAVTDPEARDHYASMPSVPVYLVLEYEGQAWKAAPPDRRRATRLFVVDAGRTARPLREKYPDLTRYVVTRGVVGLYLEERKPREEASRAEPRLRGAIEAVMPDQIFVPRPHSKTLRDLGRLTAQQQKELEQKPRYAVKVSWGTRHEPWVRDVRLLPGAEARSNSRE
jgi:hypothetical protein